MCGDTICGGYTSDTASSCLRLSDTGNFVRTNTTLQPGRYRHSCFSTEQGVLLMGDRYNPTMTELVLRDGSTLGSFTLRYNVE